MQCNKKRCGFTIFFHKQLLKIWEKSNLDHHGKDYQECSKVWKVKFVIRLLAFGDLENELNSVNTRWLLCTPLKGYQWWPLSCTLTRIGNWETFFTKWPCCQTSGRWLVATSFPWDLSTVPLIPAAGIHSGLQRVSSLCSAWIKHAKCTKCIRDECLWRCTNQCKPWHPPEQPQESKLCLACQPGNDRSKVLQQMDV